MIDLEKDASSLLGMPIDKAKELYGLSGWIIRCIKADGKSRMVTLNVMPNRINVETVGGLITKLKSIG